MANRATYTALPRTEDVLLYLAHNETGDFSHDGEIFVSAATAAGVAYLHSLANIIDDVNGIAAASGDLIGVFGDDSAGNFRLNLLEIDGGAGYIDGTSLSYSTLYYTRFYKVEAVGAFGTLYCGIYSNAARTAPFLIDLLSLTLHSSKKDYTLTYAVQSANSGQGGSVTGYNQNLDFGGGVENLCNYTLLDPNNRVVLSPPCAVASTPPHIFQRVR